MFACKRCCRKCFPNGCCGFCKPPPQVQQQVDVVRVIKKDEQKKEIPYGYINIYPGVRTSENKYTCPMLAVHLYRQAQHQADIARDNRTLIVKDIDEQRTHQGPREVQQNESLTAEETVIMVPVEDVTQIRSKAEMKQALQADTKAHITPVFTLSENCCDRCCANIFKGCGCLRTCCGCLLTCCRKCCAPPKVAALVATETTIFANDNTTRDTSYKEEHLPVPKKNEDCCTKCCNRFRCWCCRKKKLVDLIKRTYTKTKGDAQRVITVTLEYSKYSNLDSASNARLLSREDQVAYYKEKFDPDTKIEFYLVSNIDFAPDNFNVKRQQAEGLCRTVMQLKAMRDHYPSDNDLDGILDQAHKRTYGDIYKEPVLQLSQGLTTLQVDHQAPEHPAIQGKIVVN